MIDIHGTGPYWGSAIVTRHIHVLVKTVLPDDKFEYSNCSFAEM